MLFPETLLLLHPHILCPNSGRHFSRALLTASYFTFPILTNLPLPCTLQLGWFFSSGKIWSYHFRAYTFPWVRDAQIIKPTLLSWAFKGLLGWGPVHLSSHISLSALCSPGGLRSLPVSEHMVSACAHAVLVPSVRHHLLFIPCRIPTLLRRNTYTSVKTSALSCEALPGSWEWAASVVPSNIFRVPSTMTVLTYSIVISLWVGV